MRVDFATVCSGIGAPEVALTPIGWRPVWAAEIEPFPSAVLARHYPDTPNHGDMTVLPARVLRGEVAAPAALIGGTPCQAFSVAGMRRGMADPRGLLTIRFVELADAIDHVRARRGDDECVVWWENVPGVLSDKENAFGCFLAALVGESEPLVPPGGRWPDAGCVYGPRRAAAWRVLDAQYFGLAQRRRRVFVVASARDGFDPCAVLFERDGVRRDSAPRREAGKDTTGSTGDGVARCLTTGEAKRQDWETCNMVAHTLRAEGFDASEDGTGRGTPLVPVAYSIRTANTSSNGWGVQKEVTHTLDRAGPPAIAFGCKDSDPTAAIGEEVAPTLRAMGHTGSHANAGGQVAIAYMADDYKDGTFEEADTARPLTTSADRTRAAPVCLGFQSATEFLPQSSRVYSETEPSPTLQATGKHDGNRAPQIMAGMAVRRLTPRECERLQGFPDDYTAIPWRGKPAEDCPDGPRYKALGNSMAVPVIRWIGWRIHAALMGAA